MAVICLSKCGQDPKLRFRMPVGYSLVSQQLHAHTLLGVSRARPFGKTPVCQPVPLRLQAQIRERQGIDLLKFYVLFLLAFMSGLAGGRGSRLSPEA